MCVARYSIDWTLTITNYAICCYSTLLLHVLRLKGCTTFYYKVFLGINFTNLSNISRTESLIILTLSPIQQSCSRRHLEKSWILTLLKEINIFLVGKLWKHCGKGRNCSCSIVANEEIDPAGAISSFVTMFSNVVCCSRRKTNIYEVKG